MKKLILLSLLLASQFTFSQTRTGSGGEIEAPSNEKLLGLPDELPTGKNPWLVKFKGHTSSEATTMLELAQLLNVQNLACSNNRPHIDMKKMTFLEIHLALKVHQSSLISTNKCQDASAYFKCLGTPKVKKQITRSLKDKKMKEYLKHQQMKDEDIEGMIKYFKQLDKACENDACQM